MARVKSETLPEVDEARPGPRPAGLAVAAGAALVAVVAVLALVVLNSRSAWTLLSPGRGLIPEEHYAAWAFVLIAATTAGQAAGWAAGSALGHYVLTRLGLPATWATARLAMSVVYLGLGGLPLLVYHLLFGGWLLDLPRVGLDEWLRAGYPDAHWLLIRFHPWVDGSLLPLAVIFLGLLWLTGDRPRRSWLLQLALAATVAATSAAVALSLAIHATLVHIRL